MIKNKKELAITELRRQVLDLLEAGVKSVMPNELILPVLKYNEKLNTVTIVNKDFHLIKGRIFIIGGGKATGKMAEEVERIVGAKYISAGSVNTIKGRYQTSKIKIVEAEHPLPGRKGEKGVKQIFELKDKYGISKNDLVIFLISGGGSAMLPSPVAGVSLKEKQATTDLLIKSGAPIQNINTVRKHLSQVKGGQLAKYFAPARIVSLIISDVISNDLGVIASGPTAPDPKTFNDAWHVLEQYQLLNKVPASVRKYIELGCKDRAEETPKHLANADNYIIGKNAIALETIAYEARKNNFKPLIVTHELTGEPEAVAERITREIKYGKYTGYDMLLLGGETTPRVPVNAGKGGRNQHLVAAMILAMKDIKSEWQVACMATDGVDYLKGVAGAIGDKQMLELNSKKNLDIKKYLTNYDTYTLFKKTGQSQIEADETGTNVGDIMVIIKK